MKLLHLFWATLNEIDLSLIATHLVYQHLGAASNFIQWSLEEAKRRGAELWLQSKPPAALFFHKFGFEDHSSFELEEEMLAELKKKK